MMRRTLASITSIPPCPRRRVALPVERFQVKSFSSTSYRPFFFRRPTVSSKQLVQELNNALQDGRPDVIAKLYPTLIELSTTSTSSSSSSSSSSNPLLSQKKFQQLMRLIAQSPNRLNLLLKMFQDSTRIFNYSPSPLDHHLIVMGLVNSGKLLKAEKWLESLSKTYGFKPHVSDLNLLLQGWRRKRDLYEMRRVFNTVIKDKFGLKPNVVSYNTFLSALFELGKLDQVRELTREMELERVEPDLYTQTALLTGFTDQGEFASAKQIRNQLKQRLELSGSQQRPQQSDTAMVNALLKYEAKVHGFDTAVKLAQRYRDEKGIELDQWTLNTLLTEGKRSKAGLKTADQGLRLIEDLEDLVDLQADRRAWSSVISELVKGEEGIEEALKLYQIARDRSIEPDTTMIHPIVQHLLDPSRLSPESFSTAKSLYEDLSTISTISSSSSSSSSTVDFSSPEQPIYALLLQACANPTTLDLGYSRSLISDMKKRNIKLTPSTALHHIESLMRASNTYEEAFESYDHLRALDPSIFSTIESYNQILKIFLSLEFPPPSSSSSSAPPSLIMEFLTDMRKSSLPANSVTYSMLLTYYSRLEGVASLETIQHLHSLIKLDINLDPDLPLFNSLMSAYSRLKNFNQVYRIWETLLINSSKNNNRNNTIRGPDQTSLSILFDTFGYDRSRDVQNKARRIWNQLSKNESSGPGEDAGGGYLRSLKRNKKNWDTWIECLCRWGRFQEAEEIVFEEMKRKADLVTFQVLIKFARANGIEEWERVRNKVFERRPDLKEELEEVGEKSLKELRESQIGAGEEEEEK